MLVEGRAKSRAAILNRPSNLNVLNTSMVARLKRLYESWEENPDIGFVLMKGGGRAYCSGGGVVALYQLLNEGEYLALTGEKLNGVQMIACDLATDYILSARLALVEERLGKLITEDASIIETSLAQYADLVYPDRESVLHKIEIIDKCFSQDTVEEIIDAL